MRARDSPLPLGTTKTMPNITNTKSDNKNSNQLLPVFSIIGNGPNDPPMIAGQLLIYDLDETPPDDVNGYADGLAKKLIEEDNLGL